MRTNTIKLDYRKSTQMVAHRGVSGLERENTAAAFIAAGNRTYFGVETDIYHTSDGKYVCHHDGSTKRICEVDLPIEGSTFDELRALNFTDVDGATDRAEVRIATPYEYMKICKKYAKHCVPELKSNFTLEEMKEIMQIFADADYLDHTCFIAFNIANLDLVKQIRPEQECQFLTSKWDDSLPAMLAERKMGLDIHYGQLTEERIKALHDAGVEVNCWTVDDPEKALELIDWGVDYITSNILE
ncbi:MAG: hypothetical protein IJF78_07495 [Clostridia bacterium]|nr:hypothetical protein [Clostridia bacterium]